MMYDKALLEELAREQTRWEETTLANSLDRRPERSSKFISTSSEPVERLYTPLDVAEMN